VAQASLKYRPTCQYFNKVDWAAPGWVGSGRTLWVGSGHEKRTRGHVYLAPPSNWPASKKQIWVIIKYHNFTLLY